MAEADDTPRIISRKEAKKLGLMFYFTGKPCPNGHIAPRYVSVWICTGCSKMHMAELREATVERRKLRPLSIRQKAQANGDKRYFNGKPCPRGHFAERLTVNGACVECMREDRIRNGKKPKVRRRRIAYRKRNAERYRAHVRNRRAAAAQQDGTHTQEDILAILELQDGRCAYCRKKLRGKWHVDHIIPRSKNGSNDRSNLQLTCRACNLRKHNKDPVEFARLLGRLI
jgi:5-methylcytosine-specific restriction endonuclease McrA